MQACASSVCKFFQLVPESAVDLTPTVSSVLEQGFNFVAGVHTTNAEAASVIRKITAQLVIS